MQIHTFIYIDIYIYAHNGKSTYKLTCKYIHILCIYSQIYAHLSIYKQIYVHNYHLQMYICISFSSCQSLPLRSSVLIPSFSYIPISASLISQLVKNLPAIQETPVRFLGWEDPLEKGQATHCSILGLPLWLRW